MSTGRFDGESFYRAMQIWRGGGLIQGGVTSDAAKLGPPIAHDRRRQASRKSPGPSPWRDAPGAARSDFFIMTPDIPAFDGEGADIGFAAFGQ